MTKDEKNRTILSEKRIQSLAAILSKMRKSKGTESHAKDLKDCQDVLFALSVSGYAIIPQGQLDTARDILTGENT
jgi:hypothetical protein